MLIFCPPALPLPTPTYEVGVNLATHTEETNPASR